MDPPCQSGVPIIVDWNTAMTVLFFEVAQFFDPLSPFRVASHRDFTLKVDTKIFKSVSAGRGHFTTPSSVNLLQIPLHKSFFSFR
mmetsp:Transcript_30987/g.69790  ORF Transcript_30987/g.69790 Transcript_30987/m.69790 type:complete len:85 (-) Transcript_30987:1123-1377(-)